VNSISQTSENSPSVFVIGSSATLLFGPYLAQMLQGFYTYSRKGEESDQVKAAFQDLDTPAGASAGDSSAVVDYLDTLDKTDFHPDCVLMAVGMHDLKRDAETHEPQVAMDAYRKNVESIVEWFSRKQIELIWIQNGPLDEKQHNERVKSFHRFEADLEAYNLAVEPFLKQNKVTILDLPGYINNLGPLSDLVKDHTHFKDEIVKLQAAFIAGYLINRLSPQL
jgi:hypothetical protein